MFPSHLTLEACLQQALDIRPPWSISKAEFDRSEQLLRITLRHAGPYACPVCGAAAKRHDARRRTWRHLDFFEHRTLLTAEVPRVKCAAHGCRQVRVPWSEERSAYTRTFEQRVLTELRTQTVRATASKLRLKWDAVAGIQARAVARGLRRRGRPAARRICVDETAFRRWHRYATVVSDLDTKRVLYLGPGRKRETLEAYFASLTAAERAAVEVVAMDMWEPYVQAVRRWLPDGESKICFDRFHVFQTVGRGVDQTRRGERKAQCAETGASALTGTRYWWLQGEERRAGWSAARAQRFEQLLAEAERTGQAWKLKELARSLWRGGSREQVEADWNRWIRLARHSGLPAMARAAETIRRHLWGVLNAILFGVSNARSESMNALIQRAKRNACGYRNWERFRTSVLFLCGGLDLSPEPAFPHETR